jgi:hypothetical protein
MTDDRTFVLEFVAVQLVVVAAMLHVALGVFNWQRWFEAGFLVPEDTRWPLFIVSGIALLLGTAIAHTRENRRPFYAAGIAVMLSYVVGYFAWHLLGHRQYILFGQGVGTEQPSLQWFLDHLLAGPVEFGAIVVEVTAIIVLAALLYVTRANGSDTA